MTYDNEVWNEFEFEDETLPETLPEFESDGEAEFEANVFQWIGKQGKRFWQTQPWFRRIARDTASAAVGASCNEAQAAIAKARQRAELICSRAQDKIAGWESSQAQSNEFEFESENPQFEAVMEQLGKEAARAKTEAEAFAFLAPLAGLALKKFGAAAAKRFAPRLAQGVMGIGKKLFANRQTRPLIRTLPNMVRQSSAHLARRGGDPRRVLARVAHGTLSDPRRISSIYINSQHTGSGMPPMQDGPTDDSFGPPQAGAFPPEPGFDGDPGMDGSLDPGMDEPMEEAPASKRCNCNCHKG